MKTLSPRIGSLSGRVGGSVSITSWRASNASANSRGYTYAWQQARLRFLKENPLCVICEVADSIEPATVVDHKTPHRGDQVLFWDRANWQGLCKPHHDVKTQTEDAIAAF